MQIYEKFLMGTEVCEKLGVCASVQLLTLAQFARTHPKSLRQLRQVHNGIAYIARALKLCAEDQSARKALLDTYFKV
jgi:hypothetical protein